MAIEEIEISELEFTEELAGDNLIPVESSTDTKATSLQILKNWLSSFFVGKTGNETVNGQKLFKDIIRRSFVFSSNGTAVIRAEDENQKGTINYTAYYAGNGVYNRMQANNTTNGKNVYLDVIARDDGTGVFQVSGTSNIYANLSGLSTLQVPTPTSSDSTSRATTTAWVRSKLFGIDYANPTAKISDGGTWVQDSTYTAPSQGYAIITSRGDNCQLKVNETVVGRTTTDSGGGWTSSVSNVFLPLNKNDVVKAYGGSLTDCRFYFWAL